MKNIVINKRKLYITLGVILSSAVITMAPVGVMLLVKANYEKQWNYYEKFTRIGKDDLTFDLDEGGEKTLSKWSMPADGSYYMEVDEKTYVDAGGTQEKFISVGQRLMNPGLPVLNNLAIKFNEKSLPFVNSGSHYSRIYLTDQIKNLTIIFGEDLVQPFAQWQILSSNLHTKKAIINIEDRTPTDPKGLTLFSELYMEQQNINAKIKVSLTKTSGSRGHTKQEWMNKFKITDESLFSLNEQ